MSGPTKRFVFYCAVLLAAVSSVMFGLDWMSAPMPPMPETKNLVFVAPPPPPPPPAPPPAVVARPAPQATPAAVAKPAPATAPAAPPASVPAALPSDNAQNPPAENPAPLPQIAVEPAPAKCDVSACARAYRSFTEADCTYQPSDGPRRLCTKGVPPAEASGAAAPSATPADADAQTNAKCNVDACAAAYRSFRESDCTFNPSFGPRRLCEK